MSENPVLAFLSQWEEAQELYPTPEIPEWLIPPHVQYHLEFVPRSRPRGDTYSLEKIRPLVRDKILEYANTDADGTMLLCRIPPGIGKTTGSVQAIQEWSEMGGRALYVSSRKNFFPELMNINGFDSSKWWNWLPIQDDTCRFAQQIRIWMEKGQKGIEFCKQFCLMDGHINKCPYRIQKDRQESIIFGRHGHLMTGMSIDDYEIAICDEMPLSAFLDIKNIPLIGVIPEGAESDFKRLFNTIYLICNEITTKKKHVKGNDLFRYLGDTLTKLFTTFQDDEVISSYEPPTQFLDDPDEVFSMDHFYVFDLLGKLLPEYVCWCNKWKSWLSRVVLSPAGIKMYGTKKPKTGWRGLPEVEDHIPRRLVVLDASGSPSLYERLFNRPVELFAPDIERAGKAFQVTARLNGSGTVVQKNKKKAATLTKKGNELLEQCKLIAAEYPGGRIGVVTFKAIEGIFKVEFGPENVLHYGALRGSNLLESCDCLILAGGYCPNLFGVYNVAMMLNEKRMKPFVTQDETGWYHNPWLSKQVEYFLKTGDMSAVRPLKGFWQDDDLDVLLDEMRQNEMWQALHRNRIISYPGHDVWVLTSINTPEPLDGIYDSLSDVDFTPDRVKISDGRYEGITWKHWIKIKKWLENDAGDTVSVEDLATVAGVTIQTVRSQRWIHYLDEFFHRRNGEWESVGLRRVKPQDRRKQKVLEKNKE